MRRFFIIAALALPLLVGGHPKPARAAILPDCDQTVYFVQDEKKNEICTPTKTVGCIDGKGISPERYDELYPVNPDRKAHPPTVTTDPNKRCGFNDFIQLFINLASYGLGVLAVLGVAVIIWGGFGFLLAMGSQEKIKEAKQTIWGGILGTFIVLIAFVMVNWIVSMVTGTGPVLFAGKSGETHFYGDKCPTFNACSKNNLHYNPGDGCRDSIEGKDRIKNGNAVSKAQGLLTQLGCYTDSIDGCYGPQTKQAVIDFQNRNAQLFTPDTTNGPGRISSADEWHALEDAAVGAGGLLGCADAPLTKTVTMSYGNNALSLSSASATIKQDGTVTWANTNETAGEPIGIQFDMPIKDNSTERPQLSIAKKTSKSLTFPKAGSFTYKATYQFGSPTDIATQAGTINVIGQIDSAPSEQPPML